MIKAVIFDMFETLITHYESPLYFGTHMAKDAGISEEKFQSIWRKMEDDRTLGKISLEKILEIILKENNCYSERVLKMLVDKRISTKKDTFNHLHEEIIPMLDGLKDKGVYIGLISNCFSEEAKIIKNSILYPYFDAICLSYDEGIMKPDKRIFELCMKKLNVNAEECLYIGDGGSNELDAASKVGMKAYQAVWYLNDNNAQQSKRQTIYKNIDNPLEILKLV